MEKKKILIIDDSLTMRKLIRMIIEEDDCFTVIGEAADALDAREKIKLLNPDFITLDVEMPRMDGLTFLKNLMRLRPLPVLIVSTFALKNSDVAINALALGAVDYVTKVSENHPINMDEFKKDLIAKLKITAMANIKTHSFAHETGSAGPLTESFSDVGLQKIIAIGASTGGSEALRVILEKMPAMSPPIVITQHIHPSFCEALAKRLSEFTDLNVCLAKPNEILELGHVYLASDQHLTISPRQLKYMSVFDESPPVDFYKPSINVMFESLLHCNPEQVIAVILTGMGMDGGLAMKKLYDKGARTIAQDEESSVIWGMPHYAIKLKGVEYIKPLNQITQKIIDLANTE